MDRPIGNTADVYMECEKWYLPLLSLPHFVLSSEVQVKMEVIS